MRETTAIWRAHYTSQLLHRFTRCGFCPSDNRSFEELLIHISTHGMPYSSMLFCANLSSLASRREDLSYSFSAISRILPPVSTVFSPT